MYLICGTKKKAFMNERTRVHIVVTTRDYIPVNSGNFRVEFIYLKKKKKNALWGRHALVAKKNALLLTLGSFFFFIIVSIAS